MDVGRPEDGVYVIVVDHVRVARRGSEEHVIVAGELEHPAWDGVVPYGDGYYAVMSGPVVPVDGPIHPAGPVEVEVDPVPVAVDHDDRREGYVVLVPHGPGVMADEHHVSAQADRGRRAMMGVMLPTSPRYQPVLLLAVVVVPLSTPRLVVMVDLMRVPTWLRHVHLL